MIGATFSDLSFKAKHVLEPTMYFSFQDCVICKGTIVGYFGTLFGVLVFMCWGSTLQFEDTLAGIIILYRSY